MPNQTVFCVEVFGILAMSVSDRFCEGIFSLRNGDLMHMIFHEHIAPYRRLMYTACVAHQSDIHETVGIISEDFRSSIATLADMVRATWYNHTGKSRHAFFLLGGQGGTSVARGQRI